MVEYAVTRIRDAGSYWQGDAYYAAYDRVAGDRDQATKAAQQIKALAQTLTDGGDLLTGYRKTLLDKVTDATIAGFTVAEDWAVTGTGSPEQLRTHQSAVSTALNEMLDVQTTALTKIEQANTDVSALAAASAPASPISQLTGSAQADPNKTTTPAATSPTSTPMSTDTKAADASKSNNGASNTGDSNTGAAAQTSDKGKPGEWRPGDISDLIKAVGSITGTIPNLIESGGEFLKDAGELVKDGGEAIAEVTDSVTKLVTTVDQVTHHTSAISDQPATNDPADKTGAATASPDKNTAAPASTPSDGTATAAPTTPTPDKTHAADWNPKQQPPPPAHRSRTPPTPRLRPAVNRCSPPAFQQPPRAAIPAANAHAPPGPWTSRTQPYRSSSNHHSSQASVPMGNHANARVFYKPSSTSPFATKAQIRPKFGEFYGNPYSERSPQISDLGPSCSGIVNIVSRSGSAVLQRPHGQKNYRLAQCS
ncbi:hypothetical protein [Nocardia sp. NPDC059691]|uniref:hypothetical protein n=1 Tax=Nocardia sp. NPDC059691 TaxID=3346908 RepID=UPI003684D505